MSYDPNPCESEFCHGRGLEPLQYVGLPPSLGGRYRGTSPPVAGHIVPLPPEPPYELPPASLSGDPAGS